MKRPMMAGVAALVLALAVRADVVIPLVVPVSPEDEKAVRAMLGDYVKAVAAGDRAKAMSFCLMERKEDEKLTRLGCEIDFSIRRLRLMVEKKLGKEAWGQTGEKLGEMTPEAMKTIEIHPTASGDEVRVIWNEGSKVPAEKRVPGGVSIRRTKDGWRFALVGANERALKARRWMRDAIGEIEYLADGIEQSKVKGKEEFDKAVDQMVKELNTPEEGLFQNIPDGGVVAPDANPGGVIVEPPEIIEP